MHPLLLFQLLILVVVANGVPVFAKKALGEQLAHPLDGGLILTDGQPLFGPSKTVRGVLFSFLVTPLAALLTGFPWTVGAVVAAGAIAGDLFSSFVKRRLGRSPSSMAFGLDYIPESLFPLAACRLLLPVTVLDIIAGMAIFFAGGLILSPILFRLRLRDTPY
jgi:CDP-2,3-bis-(O-geranylgeranyl)-sn-glycerol synthase